ncbi:MAG: PAS domain S-box protein [Gallionella sp.]|nr:PAS domain S-box protein [Gallionella sp.]
MTDTHTASAENAAQPGSTTPYASSAWKPLLAFMLFALAITVLGYVVFQRYKTVIKIEKQEELGGIADLKIRQISTWMAERKGDAQALRDDPLFTSAVGDWLQRGSPPGDIRTKLAARLSSMQHAYAAYGYSSITLFDEQAILRLSSAADEASIQGIEKMRLLESMRTGQITFSEIHREKFKAGERIEIELRVPLTLVKNGKPRSIGAVLFRIDPYRFLFPLIQFWPTHSASAENLLVRRDGDEVLFLNELRFRKNTALSMRFPLSQSQLPAAMVATGHEGLVEGVDYRGIQVVGVLGKVAGTSWFMVSKIDQAEIYAPINHLANWILLLMLSLVGVGGGIAFFWRAKEKKQFENKLSHQRLAKHLDYLAKYANDIILLLDSTGKIIDFNDRALKAYGYSAEDFRNLNISVLRASDLAIPLADRLEEVSRAESLRFESTHVRRNGENFPVDISIRAFNIAGERFHQAIIRDITERKLAEKALAEQKDFIRQVIDSNPDLIFVKDAEGRFLLANEAMAKSYGQTIDSIVGKCNKDLVHDPAQAAAYDSAHKEVLEHRRERIAIEPGVLSDGKHHWFKTIRKPLEQNDGSLSVLTIAMDITELKEAEQEQQILNRALRLLSACNSVIVQSKEEEEEEEELLSATCKLVVETGGYRMAWVGFAEHDPAKNVRPVARYGSDNGYLDSANISWADTDRGRGPIGIAIRSGVTQVNQNFLTNPSLVLWRDAALARGYQSSIALPLRCGEQTFGTINIYSAAPDAFNANEVILLKELADNLAWGITALRTRAQRKLAEMQLEDERTRLRTLVQTIPDLVWLKDCEGVYISCNPQMERLYGTMEKDIVGKTDYDFADAALADHFRQKDREAMAAGRPSINEEWVTFPDNGQRVLLETIKAPVRDEAGKLLGVMGIARDITGRKQAQETESRLRHILDSTLDMIFIFYPDSLQFVYVNKGAIDSIGYSNEEMLLMTAPDIQPLLPEPAFRKLIAPLIGGKKHTLRFETMHRSKVGSSLPVEVQLQLVQEKGGDSVFVAIVRDITARRLAEQELQNQKAFMWQVIDTDPNQIFVTDADGNFLMANQSAAAAHGLTPVEMISRNYAETNRSPKEVAASLETDRDVIESGHGTSLVEPYTLLSGQQRWFLTIKKRLTMPDGKLSVLCVAVDITQQKLSVIKLSESYKKLQQLSLHMENIRTEERARIALNLHDEMGATLAAIKMSIAWLASKLPAGMPQLADEANHLIGLVSAGIQTMRQTVTQLNPPMLDDAGLIEAIRDYVNKFRQHTKIECILLLPKNELELNAHQSATIFRIIQESLNNVAKHAQAGEVRIALKKRGKSLLLSIEDNGIGLNPDDDKKQSFGLIGIRERALMIGGKAKISSTPGKGTKVSVSIPDMPQEPSKLA